MSVNTRENWHGNTEDEHGGSYHVVDEDDEKIAGPFASAPYATTVRDRMAKQWPTDVRVEYES